MLVIISDTEHSRSLEWNVTMVISGSVAESIGKK
jgi:hypothetical protein